VVDTELPAYCGNKLKPESWDAYGLISLTQEQLVGHRNSEFQIANGWNHAVNKTIVAQNLEFKMVNSKMD